MAISKDDNPLSQFDGLYCEAAMDGDAQKVRVYLERGGDIQQASKVHLLVIVAGRGHLDVLRVLLDAGADVNMRQPTTDLTALMAASWHGHLAIAKLLVQRGAGRHARTRSGHDALMLAAYFGRIELVDFLLRVGLDFNGRCNGGETALMRAAKRGHVAVVKTLLEAGADANQADNNGMTALRHARRHHCYAAVTHLKHYGAHEEPRTRHEHWREQVAQWVEKGSDALLKYLRQRS